MSKYDDFRAASPRVIQQHPSLAPQLAQLIERQDAHFDAVKSLLRSGSDGSAEAPLFEVDFVLLSVVNRSLDMIDGFMKSFDAWNLSTAAAVVRMQVDNLLRLVLVKSCPPGTIVRNLLSGEPLHKVIDPVEATQGRKTKLTDKRLREYAAPLYPWLDTVYEKSSGWVHFSTVHIAVTMTTADDGQISGRFPSDINQYPLDFLEQVLWAMNITTQGILEIVTDFAAGKAQAQA